jgi:hypothetical protein
MASTFPLEVVEAARWIGVPANRALRANALTEALKPKNWNPSIMALIAFPRILTLMSDEIEWTEQLGNAFLAQQVEVMAEVQKLRHKAQVAGNLKVTPQVSAAKHAVAKHAYRPAYRYAYNPYRYAYNPYRYAYNYAPYRYAYSYAPYSYFGPAPYHSGGY